MRNHLWNFFPRKRHFNIGFLPRDVWKTLSNIWWRFFTKMFRRIYLGKLPWCPYNELWSYVNPFVPNASFLSTPWKKQRKGALGTNRLSFQKLLKSFSGFFNFCQPQDKLATLVVNSSSVKVSKLEYLKWVSQYI